MINSFILNQITIDVEKRRLFKSIPLTTRSNSQTISLFQNQSFLK